MRVSRSRDAEFRLLARSLSLEECARLRQYVAARQTSLEQAAAAKRRAVRRGRPARKLSEKELLTIARWRGRGRSVRAIARWLKIPHATLARMVVREAAALRRLMAPKEGGVWQRRKAAKRQRELAERIRRLDAETPGVIVRLDEERARREQP